MAEVEMYPVNSRVATHVGYSAETQRLYYRHHNGRTTVFKTVPAEIGQAATSADSIGKFYHSNVRGQYPFEPE